MANISVESWNHQIVTTPRGQHNLTALMQNTEGRKAKAVGVNVMVTKDTESSWNVTATSTTITTASNNNNTTPTSGKLNSS